MDGKKIFSATGLIIVIAATIWLGHYFYLRHIYVISEDAFQKADIVTVSTEDVSGNIKHLFVKEYQNISKGEPLFKVDDSIYKKQVKMLEKKLSALKFKKKSLENKLSQIEVQIPQQVKMVQDKLKAELQQLSMLQNKEAMALTNYRASVEKAKSAIEAAQKGVEAAKTDLKRWQNQYKRFKELYKKGIISKQQFEEVESAYSAAQFKYRKALAELKSTEEGLKEAKSLINNVYIVRKEKKAIEAKIAATRKQITVAEASLKSINELKNSIKSLEKEIEATKAGLEKAKILLSHTLVKSPINGVVAKKWREKGDFVTPGLPVYSVYDPKTFYVLAWIEEDRIKNFKVGADTKAELEVCGKTFEGKVISIGTAAGSTFALIPRDTSQGEFTKVTQRIPVKIKLEDVPNVCIKPGTSVNVYIRKD
ncbi:HlyD family secretion protein [Desulfurobacterium sp.]